MELVGLPEWLVLATAFLLGLIFGSFGNVVIWRLPRGESLSHPGSHCPSCDTPIAWYDNVPLLSWAVLGGRCRSCDAPISARYPAVELLSGLLWLSAGVRFGATLTMLGAAFFFYLLLLLAFIDWDTMRLPNPLVATMVVVGVACAAISQFTGLAFVPLLPQGNGILSQPLVISIGGAAALSGIVLVIALAYGAIRGSQGFGTGDVKLLAGIGVFLGLYGLLALFLGTLLGAVYGVASARQAGESLRHKVPFGPFLAIGAVLATLFGPAMWTAYAGLLR